MMCFQLGESAKKLAVIFTFLFMAVELSRRVENLQLLAIIMMMITCYRCLINLFHILDYYDNFLLLLLLFIVLNNASENSKMTKVTLHVHENY
uniref:Uncharacterized protein n=1 Tax=Glossina palpalis gambiensis TaxID=67801 RepID=A0A1B0AVP6_9MUSC